jgi:DNA repair protein RecO (recombination protein O)
MPSAERSFRSEAVVLRHTDWGEADRLLTLFTLEIGKVRAVGKGLRKMRSRKAGHLEPFTRVKLLLARGRDILIVTQAETIDAYMPLREDLKLLGYTSYIVELLDRFTYEEGENRKLYHLLTDTLRRLSTGSDPLVTIHYYEIRLLDITGYRPMLFQCANCGEEILPQDQFFSAGQGGVLCPRCGEKFLEARTISMGTLKYLRHFQRSSFQEAARALLPPDVRQEMENLMQYYLTYLLERGLNTPSFIRRMRNDSGGEQSW